MSGLEELKSEVKALEADANTSWVTVNAYLVFLMQLGFAMLEAGSVRKSNSSNIMFKNLVDSCICGIMWYAVGNGIAGGGNAFVGEGPFFASEPGDTQGWFWAYGFAATASTIVSGAIAERTKLEVYFFYTIMCAGWTYPVAAHWVWGDCGWLSTACQGGPNILHSTWTRGMIDFAGSGVVHITGGVVALVGAIMVGPRRFRFISKSKLTKQIAQIFIPHNIPLMVIGTLLLNVGWYAFNAGSTLGIDHGKADVASRVTVTATVSASTSALVVSFYYRYFGDQRDGEKLHVYSVVRLCNGILAGLVSITANCATIYTPYSIFVGFGGGVIYVISSSLVSKYQIDDPLDAFSVHGACGIWGCLAAGIFWSSDEVLSIYGAGVHEAGHGGQFLTQVIGTCALVVWAAINGIFIFAVLKYIPYFGGLRLSGRVELDGIDQYLHGTRSYQDKDTMDICTEEEIEELKKAERQYSHRGSRRSNQSQMMEIGDVGMSIGQDNHYGDDHGMTMGMHTTKKSPVYQGIEMMDHQIDGHRAEGAPEEDSYDLAVMPRTEDMPDLPNSPNKNQNRGNADTTYHVQMGEEDDTDHYEHADNAYDDNDSDQSPAEVFGGMLMLDNDNDEDSQGSEDEDPMATIGIGLS